MKVGWGSLLFFRRQLALTLSLLAMISPLLFNPHTHASELQFTGPISEKITDQTHVGFLKFESIQYPTVTPGQENLSQNNMIEAGLDIKARSIQAPKLSGEAIINLGRSLNLNYSYIGVFELATTYSLSPRASVSLGRSLQNWNSADESWDLGVWQPTFSMDSLRIQQQGLTGLFFNWQSDYFQAGAFFSPLFIPTTTPDIADRNGEITSESRWFRSIPTSSQVFGKDTQLYFRLSVPDLREIVNQPGGGAQIRVGHKTQGPWARVSYANKAMNSIFFKYDASLRSGAQGSRGEIELSPIVHRHDVTGADIGFQYAGGAVTMSYIEDRPTLTAVSNKQNSDGLVTDFIQQTPQGLRAATFRWDQELRLPVVRKEVRARFDYLKAQNEATRDFDADGVEQSSLLPHRLQFTNAASLEAEVRLAEAWRSRFQFLRDFDQRGSLWKAELEYRSRQSWATLVGIDSLGTDDPSDDNPDTRFLNYYRQNDRVYGGLSYVF